MFTIKRFLSLFLAIGLFVLTGCSNTEISTAEENSQTIPRFTFTMKDPVNFTFLERAYILADTLLSVENGVSMIMYGISEDEKITYSFLNISDNGEYTANEIYSGNDFRNYCGLYSDNVGYSIIYRSFGSGEIDYQKNVPLIIERYDNDFNLLSTETADIISSLMGSVDIIKSGDYYYINLDRSNTVTRYDSDLKFVDSVDIASENGSRSELIDIVTGSDGNVYIAANNYDYGSFSLTMYNSEQITLSENIRNVWNFRTGTGNYLLFCFDDTYIYGIKPDGTVDNMMIKSDLENDSANYLIDAVEHNGVFKYYDAGDGMLFELEFKLEIPPEETRKTLTITVLNQIEEDLVEAIASFNRTNTEYRIVIDDKAANSDDFLKTFNQQILDQTVGDIIIPPRQDADNQTYVEKGIYLDLYTLLDTDEELSRENFFPNILTAMETDGHLYGLWRLFSLRTYFAPDGGLPPTYENILKLQSENPDLGIIPYGSINTYVLDTILRDNRSYFNTAEKIGGETMREALLIASKYPNPADASDEVYVSDSENRYYYSSANITDVRDYVVESNIKLNTHAVPVGNIVPEGESKVHINPGYRIGIYAESDNKEAAWDFIKYYLTVPFGGNGSPGIPALKTTYDYLKEETLSDNAKLIAEYGEGYSNYSISFGSGGSFDVPLETENDYLALEELIAASVYPTTFEGELLDIITEEAEPFFKGQKSVDEVLAIIENRAGLYIAEKS
jgi:hypothetical protein